MDGYSHLLNDAFYGHETVQLDVQEHIKTKVHRQRLDKLLQIEFSIIDRARQITEQAYRYQRDLVSRNLIDIRSKTRDLEVVERCRASAKPKHRPVPLPKLSQSPPKRRSNSVPAMHVRERSGSRLSLPEEPRSRERIHAQSARSLPAREKVSSLDDLIDETPHVRFSLPEKGNIDVKPSKRKPRKSKRKKSKEPKPPTEETEELIENKSPRDFNYEALEKEGDQANLRVRTRRQIKEADMAATRLEGSYTRRSARKLQPILVSRASQERLLLAKMKLDRITRDLEEQQYQERMEMILEESAREQEETQADTADERDNDQIEQTNIVLSDQTEQKNTAANNQTTENSQITVITGPAATIYRRTSTSESGRSTEITS